MPSKLTFHISGFGGNVIDLVERMQPSLVKVFDFASDTNIDDIRRRCPRTLIVYRQYVPLTEDREWSYNDSVEGFIAKIDDTLNKLSGRGIVWEGINEPVIKTEQEARALNAWYVKYAELLHARGEKVAAFSFSTGNPDDLNLIQFLEPAAKACDYLAVHEYYHPIRKDAELARYRALRAKFSPAAQKPVLITECGLDNGGGAGDGWQNFMPVPDQYLSVLSDYDKQLMQDAYVVGGTIFQYGAGGKWASFNVASMGTRIADYVAGAGGGAPIGTGTPVVSSGTGGGGGGTTTTPTTTTTTTPVATLSALEQAAQNAAMARKASWMPINDKGALYKCAADNKLGYPQTDEFEFQFGGATYVGQVYNAGIVYVKKNDWDHCMWAKKPSGV